MLLATYLQALFQTMDMLSQNKELPSALHQQTVANNITKVLTAPLKVNEGLGGDGANL